MDSHGEHSQSSSPKPIASNVGHHEGPDEEEHRPADSSYLDFYGRPLHRVHGVERPRSSWLYWSDENLKPWFPGVSTRLPLKRQRTK